MADPFLGEIRMFGGNFAPSGWAFCNGQLLPIAANTALFSLLGTTYGGNGQTNFGLPNFQGRVPIHWSDSYPLGQAAGVESVTLLSSDMPIHTHIATFTPGSGTGTATAETDVHVSSNLADQISPVGNIPAIPNFGHTQIPAYTSPSNNNGNLGGVTTSVSGAPGGGTVTVATAGGNQPHNNMQPFLVVAFIIALNGIFPTRS